MNIARDFVRRVLGGHETYIWNSHLRNWLENIPTQRSAIFFAFFVLQHKFNVKQQQKKNTIAIDPFELYHNKYFVEVMKRLFRICLMRWRHSHSKILARSQCKTTWRWSSQISVWCFMRKTQLFSKSNISIDELSHFFS